MSEGQQENRLSVMEITEEEIKWGKKITLYFSLSFSQNDVNRKGEIIDSNFSQEPATFVLGDGNLLPGFEEALLGLKAGDTRILSISPENAFGLLNEDNIHAYPPYQFPADLMLEKGLMINFSDAAGNDQAGVVKDFNAKQVLIDFNHPLAGAEIDFKVEILAVGN